MIKVVFWGAGQDCRENMKLIPYEWEKIAIIDKNECKTNTYIDGVVVINQEELKHLDYDYIIITSSKYALEIKHDISKLGISLMKVIRGDRKNKLLTIEEHMEFYRDYVKKREQQKSSRYTFEDRRKGSDKLFYVLAGYKPELWEIVFERMRRFIPSEIDVCLLSSGKYLVQLSKIAEFNNWSYLSTEINDVAIIQNIVIDLFRDAEYIYKMDEDIFITHKCCEKMYEALTQNSCDYEIGFVGPMIPLHTNGHFFLKRFSLNTDYQRSIGKKYVHGGRWTNEGYATNPQIPMFLWSQGNIDELNKLVERDSDKYEVTAIKYAICFILFKRSLYEEMGGFTIVPETRSAGVNGDEGQLTEFCMSHCKNVLVVKNSLCGHFSYPQQEKVMLAFMNENKFYFEVRE